jgi:hypothetical protein
LGDANPEPYYHRWSGRRQPRNAVFRLTGSSTAGVLTRNEWSFGVGLSHWLGVERGRWISTSREWNHRVVSGRSFPI